MEPDSTESTNSDASLRKKKRWSDFSPRQQTFIVLGAFAELIMTTIALRDLARRPARRVRGSKLFWVPACFVQPFGPLLYFLVGRRRTAR